VLAGLYEGALADAQFREQKLSLVKLEHLATSSRKPFSASEALQRSAQVKVLAEIKRSSPSRGILNAELQVGVQASKYESAGASAISVLTEQRGFQGSLEDLIEARESVAIPILRKDFISTEYQLLEARAFGADFALLIVAGLPNQRLVELKNFAEQLDLEVLVETHSADEVRFAVEIGATLIGVNARDLSTFETDRNLFAKVAHLIPDSAIRVAESAVRNAADVREYREAGADVVLVGEALVTGDPEALIRDFISA
jgi:indole-3-glycerol phosphate synthase